MDLQNLFVWLGLSGTAAAVATMFVMACVLTFVSYCNRKDAERDAYERGRKDGARYQ